MSENQTTGLSESESTFYHILRRSGWSHDQSFAVAKGCITADKIAANAVPYRLPDEQSN